MDEEASVDPLDNCDLAHEPTPRFGSTVNSDETQNMLATTQGEGDGAKVVTETDPRKRLMVQRNFGRLSEQWKHDNPIFHLRNLHDGLKRMETFDCWKEISFQIIFGRPQSSVMKVLPAHYEPPSAMKLFAVHLVTTNDFYPDEANPICCGSFVKEDDDELPQFFGMNEKFADLVRTSKAIELRRKLRAEQILWVIKALFGKMLSLENTKRTPMKLGAPCAWNLGGYKNPNSSYAYSPGIDGNDAVDEYTRCPSLQVLSNRFLHAWIEYRKDKANGAIAKIMPKHCLVWRDNTAGPWDTRPVEASDESKEGEPADARLAEAMARGPTIWYNCFGEKKWSDIIPLEHDKYSEALGYREEDGVGTSEFTDALLFCTNGQFLDVWDGVTPEDSPNNRVPLEGEITIEHKRIYRPEGVTVDGEGNLLPDILGDLIVVRNAFSPVFHANSLAELMEAEWIPHKSSDGKTSVGNSKKPRQYRVTVPDPDERRGACFKLSNDATPLATAKDNTVTETLVFRIIARIFALMDNFVKSKMTGPDKNKSHVRWDESRSMCQTVANWLSGVYGKHDDGSFHHCHQVDNPVHTEFFGYGDEFINLNPQVMCIPHKELMRVASIVLAADPTAYSNPRKVTSALRHYIKGLPGVVSEVLLGSRDLHLQLFKIQQFCDHDVIKMDNELIKRIVLSVRQSMGLSDGDAFRHVSSLVNLTTNVHGHYERCLSFELPPAIRDIAEKERMEEPLSQLISFGNAKTRLTVPTPNGSDVEIATTADTYDQEPSTDTAAAETAAPDDADVIPKLPSGAAVFAGQIKHPALKDMYASSVHRDEKPLWEYFTNRHFTSGFLMNANQYIVIETNQRGNSCKRKFSSMDNAPQNEDVQEDLPQITKFEYGVPPLMRPYADPMAVSPTKMPPTRLLPGDVVDEDDHRIYHDIPETDHYSPAWRFGERVHPSTLNTIASTYEFNNDFLVQREMSAALSVNAKEKRENPDPQALVDHFVQVLVPTFVCGSGGTGQTVGSYAENIERVNTSHPPKRARLHSNQSPTLPQNAIMMEAALRQPIVPYFARWKAQLPPGSTLRNKNQMQFYGMFHIDSAIWTIDSEETIEALRQTPGLSNDEGHNVGFRGMTHVKVHLVPVSRELAFKMYIDNKNLKPLIVPHDIKGGYTFSVPKDEGNCGYNGVCRHFFERDEWKTFQSRLRVTQADSNNPVEEQENEYEQDVDLVALCERKKLRIDCAGVTSALIRSSVAGSARGLGLNIGGDRKVRYLVKDPTCSNLATNDHPLGGCLEPLGVVSRTAPCHLPLRELDPPTAFWLKQVETSYSLSVQPNGKMQRLSQEVTDVPKFKRLLLSSMLVRLTGKVEALASFLQKKGACVGATARTDGTYPQELFDGDFCRRFAQHAFDVSYRGRGKNATVEKEFLTDQYLKSLPKYGSNAFYFKSVIQQLPDIVEDVASELLRLAKKNTPRFEDAVLCIKRRLGSVLNGQEEKNNIAFPCLQIMLDLDNIMMDKPWGDQTYAVYLFKGYGGDQGLSVMSAGSDPEPNVRRRRRMTKEMILAEENEINEILTNMVGDPIGLDAQRKGTYRNAKNKQTSFLHFLRSLKDFKKRLEEDLSDKALTMLGWSKEPIVNEEGQAVGSTVISLYNGRPIRACDVEHGPGCTNYSQISRARGTRSSNAPNPHRSHCHPCPAEGVLSNHVMNLFNKIVAQWVAVHRLPDPQVHIGELVLAFQVHGETV